MSESVIERTSEHWVLHSKNPIYDAVLDDEEMDLLGRAWLREKIGDVDQDELLLFHYRAAEALGDESNAALMALSHLIDALDGGQEDTDA